MLPPVACEVREAPTPVLPTQLRIEVRAVWLGEPVPGDLTGDRRVDLDDLLLALRPEHDLGDLLLVQGNFGFSDRCVWVLDGVVTDRTVVFGAWVWLGHGVSWATVAYD